MTMRRRLLASVCAAALVPLLPDSATAQQRPSPAVATPLAQYAEPRSETSQAHGLLLRGEADRAEQILLRVARRDDGERADAEALLGDIALRRGDPVAAEQHYRAALSRRPGLPTARAGLYDSLQQLGRFAEAEQLLQRLGGGPLAAVGSQRAEALRAEAGRTDDPEAALDLLRAAVAATPADPWTRLDAARLLARRNRGAEGHALIAELIAVDRPSNAALHAAALFASENGNAQDAIALIERIPDRVRTTDQTLLLRSVRIRQAVEAAAGAGDHASARARLLSLVTRPDPTGEVSLQVVRALIALNDRQGAAEAAQAAAGANRHAPPAGAIAIANALADGGLGYEAVVMAQGLVGDRRLTNDERRRLRNLMAGTAVRVSTRPTGQGEVQPAPVLPPNPAHANPAMARPSHGAATEQGTQQIAEAILQRNPRNIEARQAVMDATAAAQDWDRVDALLAEARALQPSDPRISMLEARFARARGDTRRAQLALEQAATQRRDQLGVNQPIGSYAPAAPAAPQQAALDRGGYQRTPLAGRDQPAAPAWATQPDSGGRAVPAVDAAAAPRQYAQVYRLPAPSPQYEAPQPPATQPLAAQPLATQPLATQPPASQPQASQPQASQLQAPLLQAPRYVTPQAPAPYASPGVRTAVERPVRPEPFTVPSPAPAPTPFRLMPSTGTQVAVTADPLLSDISRQLSEVREEAAPRLSASFSGRARSGDAGLDRLREYGGTAEGSTAMPGIGGRIVARVSPVSIDAGDLGSDVTSLRRYGTNVLQLPAGADPALTSGQVRALQPSKGTVSGVGLGVAYLRDNFSIDVGTTPLGFERQNVVGGIEIAPSLGQGARLRLTAERRGLTDSLLSWAGARDPATGRSWGGVVRTSGRAALELTEGETDLYVLGGYGTLEGENVADNSRFEAGAGFHTPVFRTPTDELVVGLDLTYLAYDKNLRLFTLGHGGYFSPQSFVAATVPIDYRARTGNLFWRVGASAGFSTFREDRSAVFPNDPSLQRQLEERAATDGSISAFYSGQTANGFAGGVRADVEYAVSPALRLGALARYDRSGDWNDGRAMVFARYRLGQ